MSKGGGQGSFAQMQAPDLSAGGFGGGMPPPPGMFGSGGVETIAPPKLGTGMMFSGGNPNFDERTGQFRTGGFKPPRGPAVLEPIKMQPPPFQPVLSDGPDFRPPPPPTFPRTGGSMPVERVNVPAIPDYILADLESRGTVGPRFPNPDASFGMGSKGGRGGGRGMSSGIGGKGGRDDRVYAGGNPNFDERTGRYRSPPFNPGGDKYFPLPVVEQPRRTPEIPGRNTQFQMPYFGSPYGRMKPYEGRFSGYGVPTNIFSFAQPHYQPYVPGSYSPPPPSMSLPPGENGPLMQLPPSQNSSTFSGGRFGGGYGGIGGFGRYNLGLAGSQLR